MIPFRGRARCCEIYMHHCQFVYHKSRMDGPKWNPDLGGEKRVTSSVRCGRFKVSFKAYREFMSGTAEGKHKIIH